MCACVHAHICVCVEIITCCLCGHCFYFVYISWQLKSSSTSLIALLCLFLPATKGGKKETISSKLVESVEAEKSVLQHSLTASTLIQQAQGQLQKFFQSLKANV